MIKKQKLEDNGLEYRENALDKTGSGFAKNYMYKEEIIEEGHTKTFNLYTGDYPVSKDNEKDLNSMSNSSLSSRASNENDDVSSTKKNKKSLFQIIISFFKSLFGLE